MTATDAQVRIALIERKKGKTQQQAAARANLAHRGTVAKYERLGKMPSELKKPRTYRTRVDPFADDWPEMAEMLVNAPELEAKALFEWLCEQQPGKYKEGQLRTFQRRVSDWKAFNCEKMATLEQVHVPGEAMQTDGVHLNDLEITIQGALLRHILIHSVLPYSNWEWGIAAQSESLMALTQGFQAAIHELGHVPRVHQTDNTTAATHNLPAMSGKEDGERAESGRYYNDDYLSFLDHYGVKPRTTHLDTPDENGDIEAANGALQRSLEQHLLLRGSRDFESLEDYENWLQEIMRRRNQQRQERLAEELAVMKPLTAALLATRREVRPRVSRTGTIRVLKKTYSVPSGLIGRIVTVYVHEWHVEVYFNSRLVCKMPRLIGPQQADINYRHVIGSLLRKPGGFRRYRYREHMFPTVAFRRAWEALDARMSPRRADLAYLRILKLAADTLQTEVEVALELVMPTDPNWDDETISGLVEPTTPPPPQMEEQTADLSEYDGLLQKVAV